MAAVDRETRIGPYVSQPAKVSIIEARTCPPLAETQQPPGSRSRPASGVAYEGSVSPRRGISCKPHPVGNRAAILGGRATAGIDGSLTCPYPPPGDLRARVAAAQARVAAGAPRRRRCSHPDHDTGQCRQPGGPASSCCSVRRASSPRTRAYPLADHPAALSAALAAECAGAQGQFSAMADTLFAAQDSLETRSMAGLAAAAGVLNDVELLRCFQDRRTHVHVEADVAARSDVSAPRDTWITHRRFPAP